MEPLTIRQATPSDLAALAALEAACFSDPWGECILHSHLAGDGTLTLIAETEGKEAAGYCAGIALPPEGELYRIAVLPAFRRCGIGKLLLDTFLTILAGRDADTCYLEVRKGNEAAVALYENAGFFTVGVRKNYYRDPVCDALVMRRE